MDLMTDEAYERLKELIEKCDWRKEYDGVGVCNGMLGVCVAVIDNGKCPICIHFFNDLKEEGK